MSGDADQGIDGGIFGQGRRADGRAHQGGDADGTRFCLFRQGYIGQEGRRQQGQQRRVGADDQAGQLYAGDQGVQSAGQQADDGRIEPAASEEQE